jgi:putative CocE/NonD family hydrolase
MRSAITLGSVAFVAVLAIAPARAQQTPAPQQPSVDRAAVLKERYEKREVQIAMRDGVKLFTTIYAPRDHSQKYPILLKRTPYGLKPYGADAFASSIGPDTQLEDSLYIFAGQDVRGCYMSEGLFDDMRPIHDDKSGKNDIDEASDTYDTIEWLVHNVDGNNGKVGMSGISYPGFYAAAGMIDAHPALAAVSPQAPVSDWFFDDFHHHGAFFLPHAFNFEAGFGRPRPKPTPDRGFKFDVGTPDGYDFFLKLGAMPHADERWFHGEIAMWENLVAHPNYDAYWSDRNVLPHLKHVAPAVMTVGGWFDAEDLYGALHVYSAVERQNPGVFNVLVMGPWAHGGWSRSGGDKLGHANFGAPTSEYYRAHIEFPFFEHFLKGRGEHGLAEAEVFDTGANQWHEFDHWPPSAAKPYVLHLRSGARLETEAATATDAPFDEWVSDPAKPVPFSEAVAIGMTREYMTDDQRFAERRPDVVTYSTAPLASALSLAGPLDAELVVSTSGDDSDWVVKLIDVFPPDAKDPDGTPAGWHAAGYEMMVRSEVLRGRFRESYSTPKRFVANGATSLTVHLQDVLHTFGVGHRLMVQVQSTWFPLVDRNPQKWVDNIFAARDEDFVKATQRVWHDAAHDSRLRCSKLD